MPYHFHDIQRSRNAIDQFNASDSPYITLKLEQNDYAIYLSAATLSVSERIVRRVGCGSANLAKIVEFLFKNHENLFPAPLARNYSADRLTQKLHNYRDSWLRSTNYPFATHHLSQLVYYLKSFEERLEWGVATQNKYVLKEIFYTNETATFLEKHEASILQGIERAPALFTLISFLIPWSYTRNQEVGIKLINALGEQIKNDDDELFDNEDPFLCKNFETLLCEILVERPDDAFIDIFFRTLEKSGIEKMDVKIVQEFLRRHCTDKEKKTLAAIMACWLPDNFSAFLRAIVNSVYNQGSIVYREATVAQLFSDCFLMLSSEARERLAMKTADGSGLLHFTLVPRIFGFLGPRKEHRSIPLKVLIELLKTISSHFSPSQMETLFSSNNKGIAPFHLFIEHYFRQNKQLYFTSESEWWQGLIDLIACIPSSCLAENLSTNEQTVLPSLSTLLEEKLSRETDIEKISQDLEQFIKAVPAASLKYIFTYHFLRFIAIEKHQLLLPITQNILLLIPPEDKTAFRIEALAALKSLINYTAFFDSEQPATKAQLQSINNVINLFAPVASIDDVTENKPELFINILQHTSLAQGYYNKHPLDFTQRINSLGGFAALPQTIQEKVCFILLENELSTFVSARMEEREKILKTPLSFYSAEEKDFLSIFHAITVLDSKTDFSSAVKTISFLLDHFSPFHFICLLETSEYQSIVATYLPCFLQFHTKMLLPYFSCHALSKIQFESFEEEIRSPVQNTFMSKVEQELCELQLEYDKLVETPEVAEETVKPQESSNPPNARDILLVRAEFCLPSIVSLLNKLKEHDDFSKVKELLEQYNNKAKNLLVLFEPLQKDLIHSYVPPQEFYDSILGTVMTIPLILPFKDKNENLLENTIRLDTLYFKKPGQRVIKDGEVLYKNPYGRQEYPKAEFIVDEKLKAKIEEWKNARPYWEEYLDKHFLDMPTTTTE